MGMVVRTNTMALNAYRQLGLNNSAVAKSLEKLASGYRINRAGDDAAGLAISEKMKAQITGLETASANAQDGISLIQTAEGNLGEVHDMLNRMVELATKSANGTYTATERQALQDEVNQLLDEIDRISQSANFNGAKLLDGSMGLNTTAMSIGSSADAVKALKLRGDGINGQFGTDTLHITDANHISVGQTATTPEFIINFADYTVTTTKGTAASAGDYALINTLSVDGKAITKYVDTADNNSIKDLDWETNKTAAAAGTVKAGEDIAGVLDNKTIVIGNELYTAAKTDATVKFTYAGYLDDEGKAVMDTNPREGAWAPTGDVKITTVSKDADKATAAVTGRTDCHVVNLKDPVNGSATIRSGAKMTLTEDMLKDGNTLKIGETVFTFKKGEVGDVNLADNVGAAKDIILVDGLTGDDLLKSVTEQLSYTTAEIKKTVGGAEKTFVFSIGRSDDIGGIEIEEHGDKADAGTAATKTDVNDALGGFTKNELLNAVTLSTKAVNATTKLSIKDNAALFEGDTVIVNNRTYTFGDGSNGTVKIGDTAEDTLKNLGAALKDVNFTVDGDTISIEAKANTDKAPVVAGSGLTLQIGDTADSFNKMTVKVADMSARGLDINGLSIMSETSASNAIDKIKDAINTVSTTRAGMGALQNRLEHTINNLDVAAENLSAANSRIRDTDMAKEMMNYTKMNVLVQSAQAMLAQANQQPQSVLQLLQ